MLSVEEGEEKESEEMGSGHAEEEEVRKEEGWVCGR